MSQEPNRSLSHKLRQLGRLNLKPRHNKEDAAPHKTSPVDTDFRIVQTPDRLVTARPIPSVEECREEIKRWHREAAKRGKTDDDVGEEDDDDDDDDVEFSLTPTVSRETSTRESRRLAGEWAIQSTRRVASPEISACGDDGRSDGEMARGLGVLSLGGDKKEGTSTARNKTKDLSYGDFPIFQPLPGQIPRETDTNKIKPPPLKAHIPPPGFLSPDDTEKAYTKPRKSLLDKRKSPLPNDYTFASSFSTSSSDFSSSSEDDTPTATIQPLPHPLHQNLYARGLCPSCLHPRSKIEARRCGRCQAHLSAYYNRGTAGDGDGDGLTPGGNEDRRPPEPVRQRPVSPLSTASVTKSPPPLRERGFLSLSERRDQQGSAKNQAASPTPTPVPAPTEKRGSPSLRNMAVSPARDYTYLPLVESERRPVLWREGSRGGGKGTGFQSRSRSSSRGRRREGIGLGLGLGLERGDNDPRYVAQGDDADLLVSIYEEYDDGEGGVGENRSRYTFGGYV